MATTLINHKETLAPASAPKPAQVGSSTSGGEKPARGLFIQTYGCQMNVYDSERIADVLAPLGYGLVDTPDRADMVVLNTCHIREKATEKVYSEVGRIRRLKTERQAQGQDLKLVVAGCVAQAEGEEIMRRAPVVDLVVGPQSYHRLPELVARTSRALGQRLETDFEPIEKFDALPIHRDVSGPSAFVSIQEGCDKFCSFCVVPYTRGAEYSRSADAILAEVRALAARGVKEINLLGQNVNAWHGAEPAIEGQGAWGLAALLHAIGSVGGIRRVTYTTSHPKDMDQALIAAHGSVDSLLPYLHLPVQSGSDRVLKAMNRKHTRDHYFEIVQRLKAARPELAMASDFIVGFPGETDADFDDTMDLVRTVTFSQAYSFKYSKRPGTPAAELGEQVSDDIKNTRLQTLQTELFAQQLAFNQSKVGGVLEVMVTGAGRHHGQLAGRSVWQQAVHFEAPDSLIGEVVAVKVESATRNALGGVLVERVT